MEPLWSPVVANGGNRSQIEQAQKPRKQPETVAVGCDPLPIGAHGKGRVDATSLLLKRGLPSSLRKERRVLHNPNAVRDATATLTGQVRRVGGVCPALRARRAASGDDPVSAIARPDRRA